MGNGHLKHYEPWPLDLAILPLLPPEGTMLGNVHYVGRRARDLADQLGVHVTSAQVGPRLNIMRQAGLVERKPATGGLVWQRTRKGDDMLRKNGMEVPT